MSCPGIEASYLGHLEQNVYWTLTVLALVQRLRPGF